MEIEILSMLLILIIALGAILSYKTSKPTQGRGCCHEPINKWPRE